VHVERVPAEAGTLITIAAERSLPIKLIGIGETLEDLQDYDPLEFAVWLLPDA